MKEEGNEDVERERELGVAMFFKGQRKIHPISEHSFRSVTDYTVSGANVSFSEDEGSVLNHRISYGHYPLSVLNKRGGDSAFGIYREVVTHRTYPKSPEFNERSKRRKDIGVVIGDRALAEQTSLDLLEKEREETIRELTKSEALEKENER